MRIHSAGRARKRQDAKPLLGQTNGHGQRRAHRIAVQLQGEAGWSLQLDLLDAEDLYVAPCLVLAESQIAGEPQGLRLAPTVKENQVQLVVVESSGLAPDESDPRSREGCR